MRKITYYLFIMLFSSASIAQTWGEDSLFTNYSFEVDGTDSQGNVNLVVLSGAEISADTERGGNVGVVNSAIAGGGLFASGEKILPDDLEEMTFSTWFYWDASSEGNYNAIMSFGSKANLAGFNYFTTRLPNNRGMGFVQAGSTVSGGAYREVAASNGIEPEINGWTHVAFTIKNDQLKLYRNAVEVASGTLAGALPLFVKDTINLSSHLHTTGFRNSGKFDDTKFFHKALTEQEIRKQVGQYDASLQLNAGGNPVVNGSVEIEGIVYQSDANGSVSLTDFYAGRYAVKIFDNSGNLIGSESFVLESGTTSFTFDLIAVTPDPQKPTTYAKAAAWYPFDLSPENEKEGLDITEVNTTYAVDATRGYVAQVGSNSFMTLDNAIATDEDYSITFWYRWDETGLPAWREMFAITNKDNPRKLLYLTPYHGFTSQFEFPTFSVVWADPTAETDDWDLMESGYDFLPSQWAHVALVYSQGDVALYVNGQFRESRDFYTTNESLNPSLITLGHNQLNSGSFTEGAYDDFAIFDYALRPEEVSAIATNTVFEEPDAEKYVMNVEDYILGNWTKETEGDVEYVQYSKDVSTALSEESLRYGLIDVPTGNGERNSFHVWARVKADTLVEKVLYVKEGDDFDWHKTEGTNVTSGWEWKRIYTTSFRPGGVLSLEFAPASAYVKIDQVIITIDRDFDPNEYIEIDVTAPSEPSNVTTNKTATGANVSWTASTDDVGITVYDVVSNNVIYGQTRSNTLNIALPSSRTFDFKVRARDAAGNASESTTSGQVTTDDLIFNVDYSSKHQVIDHFASSDGWGAEWIGSSWTESTREEMAKLLFSTEMSAGGQPEGIGLSSWRFNIGNGSIIPGLDGFRAETEIMRDANGNYDWTKQAGAQWFMSKAREYGTNHFVGWITSPPYYWTQNGYTFRDNNVTGDYNIQSDKYDDFATYLAKFAKHFGDEGFNFRAISPINEPQYDWFYSGPTVAKQSGSKASNEQIAQLVREMDNAFTAEGVIGTKIAIAEAGSHPYLAGAIGGSADNQIYEFWNSASSNYLGNLTHMANVISAHSYFGPASLTGMVSQRTETKNNILSNNNSGRKVDFWQTEYSILGTTHNSALGITNEEMDEIDYSLWLARIIHTDMVHADASGWSFWTSFSLVRSGANLYRFGLFNYDMVESDIIRAGETKARKDGWWNVSKNLWTLGQYSRFVRPGMVRLGTGISGGVTDVQALSNQFMSAYVDEENETMSIVIQNVSSVGQYVTLNLENFPEGSLFTDFKTYQTTATKDLYNAGKVDLNGEIFLPAKSIVTLNGQYGASALSVKFTINSDYPLEGATVTVDDREVLTDDNGLADFGSVLDGSYALNMQLDTVLRSYDFILTKDTVLTYNISIDSTIYYSAMAEFSINGYPFEGAAVTFDTKDFTTNSLGIVDLGEIAEGTQAIKFQEGTFIREFDFVISSDSTFKFDIPFDSTALNTFSGVFTINNQSFEGGRVSLAGDDYTTPADGVIDFGEREDGEFNLTLSKGSFNESFDFILESDTVINFNTVIDSSMIYSLDVAFMVNSKPFQGANITFYDEEYTTPANGTIQLVDVLDGTHPIMVQKDTLMRVFQLEAMSNARQEFNFEFDSTIYHDVQVLFTVNNVPFVGAGTQIGTSTMTTDSQGSVEYSRVAEGDQSIMISKDTLSRNYNFVLSSDTVLNYNIPFDSTIYHSLEARFTVNDKPFEGALIGLDGNTMTTPATGILQYEKVEEGLNMMTLEKDTVMRSFEFDLTSDSIITFNVEFDSTIYWSAKATIMVNNVPFIGATVSMGGISQTSDTQGTTMFGDLAAGDYTIMLEKDTLTRMYTVILEQDTTFFFNIDFDSTVYYQVNAGFTINENKPWVGAEVTFMEETQTTTGTGIITLGTLPADNYSLMAVQGEVSETYNFSISSDTTVFFNLEFDSMILSNDALKYDFLLYPNPTKNFVSIKTKEQVLSVKVLDIGGRVMSSSKPLAQEFTIDMSYYMAGTYVLFIQTESGYKEFKVIKE